MTPPRRALLQRLVDAGGRVYFDRLPSPSKRLATRMWPLVRQGLEAYAGPFYEITPEGRLALLATRK